MPSCRYFGHIQAHSAVQKALKRLKKGDKGHTTLTDSEYASTLLPAELSRTFLRRRHHCASQEESYNRPVASSQFGLACPPEDDDKSQLLCGKTDWADSASAVLNKHEREGPTQVHMPPQLVVTLIFVRFWGSNPSVQLMTMI